MFMLEEKNWKKVVWRFLPLLVLIGLGLIATSIGHYWGPVAFGVSATIAALLVVATLMIPEPKK